MRGLCPKSVGPCRSALGFVTRIMLPEQLLQIRGDWHRAPGIHVRTTRVSPRNPDSADQNRRSNSKELTADFTVIASAPCEAQHSCM